jgi:SAM-dependent methyltransferase
MSDSPASGDGDYWDGVAEQPDGLPAGWRRHARRAQLRLIESWAGAPSGRWLKTDLFEERSPARALLPHLDSATWIGTDVSTTVADQARAACGARPLVADVRSLPFGDATFDGVLSTSTLDHFADRSDIGRSLRELHRVLRPGGRLIVTFDNRANPLIRLRNALPASLGVRTGLAPFTVGHTVDAAAGRTALADAGFAVDATAHLLHAPHIVGTRPAGWAWYERQALPRLDRLAATRLARFTGHYVAFSAHRLAHR